MITLRSDSVKLTVADMENAEVDIACYVQRYTYDAAHHRMPMDAESYDQVNHATKNLLKWNRSYMVCLIFVYFSTPTASLGLKATFQKSI